MITVNNFILQPTIFPDKTSQIWLLPPEVIDSDYLKIDWRFEEEREIIDLLSLRKLMPDIQMSFYIPYLPYARQDKKISNDSTFNLQVFADLINSMNPAVVEAADIHSWRACKFIKRLVNIDVRGFQKQILESIGADVVVYPDDGAAIRYDLWYPNALILEKKREPLTGTILGQKISEEHGKSRGTHYLILDDLCDGGATFIGAANCIREYVGSKNVKISLFTTHGIYSKGRSHLEKEGIDLYTTDSLVHNRQHRGVIAI